MVCKLPSVRSLSKARSEGALRENMANADMSASVKEMSTSSPRGSGMVAKPLRTKEKSASAERCLRALGGTRDIGETPAREHHIVQVRGYFRIDVYERPVPLTQ